MKVRTGWVSNSSSSSFCIYGTYIDEESVKEIAGNEDVDPYEFLEELFEDEKLSVHWPPYSDLCVGAEITDIGMDETKRQFQERITKLIKEKLGDEYNCDWHEESYYS